ncbi:MAG: ABC transporter permease [Thermoleophilaceae bacterium]
MTAAAAQPVIPSFGGHADSCVRHNGTLCWSWVSSHWGSTLRPAMIDHLELAAIAVGLGFVLAFATALIAYRYGRIGGPISLFYALLYTIPAFALFQLLVPITGLTRTSAEIALVSYTLLVIFLNTLTGLREVPDEVRESARAMGLTSRQSFLQVELPLAVPAIVTGVRQAVVLTIGLTTIAAYIINQGLGKPIFDGIQTNFNTEFVAAGILAILLAILADALLAILQRVLTPWARARRAV